MTSAVPYAEVIGDPIRHSKSPLIHGFWLTRLGIDGEYRATQVGKDDLPGYLHDRRRDPLWRGCNLTMPLKELALPHAKELRPEAELVKATNCLVPAADRSLIAYNSDVDGIRAAINQGCERRERSPDHVVTLFDVIGTGGAARAALAELRGLEVTVFGRDVSKARELAREFGPSGDELHHPLDVLARLPFVPDPAFSDSHEPIRDRPQHHDYVLINATSLGMTGHPPLDIRLDAYPANTVVIDMVYDPLQTDLLKEARRLGMVAVDGLTMLIGQAARAFELFFGAQPPREHDAELRALLTA
nr:shikimate dehydrogenase [uncultured Sphingomonas sp.]